MKLRILPGDNVSTAEMISYYNLPKLKNICTKNKLRLKNIIFMYFCTYEYKYALYVSPVYVTIYVENNKNIVKRIRRK